MDSKLAALGLILVIILLGAYYELPMKIRHTAEAAQEQKMPPSQSLNSLQSIDTQIAAMKLPRSIDRITTLVDVSHYPGIETIKYRYDVRTLRSASVDREKQQKLLLKKNCNDQGLQSYLKDGYKVTHAYHSKKSRSLLYTLTVNKTKCIHRGYPGKSLKAWDGWSLKEGANGGVEVRTFGPWESKSEIITVR